MMLPDHEEDPDLLVHGIFVVLWRGSIEALLVLRFQRKFVEEDLVED